MNRLIRHILLFLLPAILVLVLLPVDRRMAYQGLQDDCFEHGLWIHDRIFTHEKEIELLFLGSSHTINAVDDELIEQETGISTANLGYCRLGRNFHGLLLNEVLEKHQPRMLILEIRESEDEHSHPIFPYLASTSEVILPDFVWNRDYVDDVQTHLSYKLDLFQDRLWGEEALPIRQETHGFSVNVDTAKIEVLLGFQARKKKSIAAPLTGLNMQFPRRSLHRISTICSEHDVQLAFLYLPSFGTSTHEAPSAFYSEIAPVIIPPDSMLRNTNFWHDPQHLNKTGAAMLSTWLSQQLSGPFRPH